ncbi:MAG TPA: hypothetical protein VNE82_05600, partial [Candidatus Binataceae bacterium]|nr:hypothetical protein [Candidatus Binataceae bacterium]
MRDEHIGPQRRIHPVQQPRSKLTGEKSWVGRRPIREMSLTARMFLLVLIAVLPAIGIQAYNEYDLRKSRAEDIRQRVIQIT